MDPTHADLFATKGLEYLLVIAYLAFLTGFWTLGLREPKTAPEGARALPWKRARGWFSLPEGFHFHPGHAWAIKEAHGILRVGMDEFSRRLLGSPSALMLPEVGTQLKQGDRGWTVMVDGRAIPMFTPVEGEVVEVNELALESPELALRRPYDDGWLLKVKVDPDRCPLRNLLSGEVALAWLRRSEERVRAIPMGELGVALPDGGEPVDGFVRAMSPEGWDELAREMLWSDPC